MGKVGIGVTDLRHLSFECNSGQGRYADHALVGGSSSREFLKAYLARGMEMVDACSQTGPKHDATQNYWAEQRLVLPHMFFMPGASASTCLVSGAYCAV